MAIVYMQYSYTAYPKSIWFRNSIFVDLNGVGLKKINTVISVK